MSLSGHINIQPCQYLAVSISSQINIGMHQYLATSISVCINIRPRWYLTASISGHVNNRPFWPKIEAPISGPNIGRISGIARQLAASYRGTTTKAGEKGDWLKKVLRNQRMCTCGLSPLLGSFETFFHVYQFSIFLPKKIHFFAIIWLYSCWLQFRKLANKVQVQCKIIDDLGSMVLKIGKSIYTSFT